jgi:hypothetical protein
VATIEMNRRSFLGLGGATLAVFTTTDRSTMVFNSETQLVNDPWGDERRALQAARRRTDAGETACDVRAISSDNARQSCRPTRAERFSPSDLPVS